MGGTARTRFTASLGLALALPLVLAACGGAALPSTGTASPAVAPTPLVATPTPPANLTNPPDTKRGQGGTLRLLWWQAPTILNLHLAQGTKDFDAARLIVEPLATFSLAAPVPDIPVLAKEIPSAANGGVTADGTSVTWKLKEGVTWSDGAPFTAADVIFTWTFVMEPKNGATTVSNYDTIKEITAPDATTVRITFKEPTAIWYLPFTGVNGAVLPKHILEKCPDVKICAFNTKPVGTGPYVVKEFKPGDVVNYVANEKYREPNAPYFAAVEMKGGGDANTAVKAVQTGQADYAWNPQVAPEILTQFAGAGGVLESVPGAGTERIFVNFADPSIEVDGERSSPKSTNPFWADKNIRQALALAVDRTAMAENLYGAAGVATNTTIPTVWPGAAWSYDPQKANALLEAAGWKKGADGIREKGGKKFAITFRTAINAVRDKEAQLIKQNLRDVGIAMEIRNVDGGVFFGQSDNPDSRTRFETDLEVYTNDSRLPDMQQFFSDFTSDKIAQKSNAWKGTQVMRWVNPEYDAAVARLRTERNPERRVALFMQIDQILVNDYAQIPLIARRYLAAHVKGLAGVNLTTWDSDVWNIAHWTKP